MANSTIVYACTQSGLVLFNKPGTSPDWLPPRMALQGQPVSLAWADAGPPVHVLAVSGDNLLFSENGGRDWQNVPVLMGVTALAAWQEPQSVLLGNKEGMISVTYGAGIAWEEMEPVPYRAGIAELLADSRNAGKVYVLAGGESARLFYGNPDAGDWLDLEAPGLMHIAQDSSNGDVYAITSTGVRKSSDAGRSWSDSAGSPSEAQALLVLPGPQGQPPSLLVGTSSGLSLSPDGGATWQTVALPKEGGVTALARDPERRDRVYVATESGFLFESGNRGQTWQPINQSALSQVANLFILRF